MYSKFIWFKKPLYLLYIFAFGFISCIEGKFSDAPIHSSSEHKHDHQANFYYTLKLESNQIAHELSKKLNITYVGAVGELKDYHLFSRKKENFVVQDPVLDFFKSKRMNRRGSFDDIYQAEDIALQVPRLRVKRGPVGKGRPDKLPELNLTRYHALGIDDPGFPRQWHFHNQNNIGNDLNVVKLWEEGITGKGVTVAIVDDGIDYEHHDIKDNFFAEGSYDFNDQRPLPMPMLPEDTHGTRCAGQIAGIRNDACGVGIAFESKVSGIRVLSKEISDDAEATAINYKYQINQIYSCSWGPPDDGLAMDKPPRIVEQAIENGVINGRQKKGSIFVFASGNGGFKGDNCNFDGYTNSIYSITVGSVDAENGHPGYSESCTAMMITAYSSGNSGARIYTSSSWHNQCTDSHGGTSAAAPMMAGIIALALQKRPDLTWRDFQHISVQAAVPVNLEDESWSKTWAGRWYSSKYGYGKVDGYKYVHHAMNFTSKNQQTKLDSPTISVQQRIPQDSQGIISSFVVKKEYLSETKFKSLEHVTITVHITHGRRSDIAIQLISPNGIVSDICVPREKDNSDKGFPNWTFMTVKHWDENPEGEWKIRVMDVKDPFAIGDFISWKMTLYGDSHIPLPHTEEDRPTVIHNTQGEIEEKVTTGLKIDLPSTITQSIDIKGNLTATTESIQSTLLSMATSASEPIKSPIASIITIVSEKSTVSGVKEVISATASPEATQQKLNSPAYPNLVELAKSYQPNTFVYLLLMLCLIVLIMLGIILYYRHKNAPYRDQQMRELSLLNDESEYQLQGIDETYHDDDVQPSNHAQDTVTNVLYVANEDDDEDDENDDGEDLLLDVNNQADSNDDVRSLD